MVSIALKSASFSATTSSTVRPFLSASLSVNSACGRHLLADFARLEDAVAVEVRRDEALHGVEHHLALAQRLVAVRVGLDQADLDIRHLGVCHPGRACQDRRHRSGNNVCLHVRLLGWVAWD